MIAPNHPTAKQRKEKAFHCSCLDIPQQQKRAEASVIKWERNKKGREHAGVLGLQEDAL